MYFKIEIVPKFQFLTVVVGVDGLPYFLYRDLKKVLAFRSRGWIGRKFSPGQLEAVANPARKERPMSKLKQVLPAHRQHAFKYENFFIVSEEDLFRVMQFYVKDRDRELYDWFSGVWSLRDDGVCHVLRPANQSSLEKVLQAPWLASCNATMPRFVSTNHLSDEEERVFFPSVSHATSAEAAAPSLPFRLTYYPLLVAAALGYYSALMKQPSGEPVEMREDNATTMTADEETCDEETCSQDTEVGETTVAAAAAECAMEEGPMEEEQVVTQNLNNEGETANILETLQPRNGQAVEFSFDELEVTQPANHEKFQQDQQKSPVTFAACLIDRKMYQVGLVSIDKFPDFIVASHEDITVTYRPVSRKTLSRNQIDALESSLTEELDDGDEALVG